MLSIFIALWIASVYSAFEMIMGVTATLSVAFVIYMWFNLRYIWSKGHTHEADAWDTELEKRNYFECSTIYVNIRRVAIITFLISLLMPSTDVIKLAVYAHVGTKVYEIAKESNPEIGKLPVSVTKLMTSWVDAKTREFEKELTAPADTTK